MTTGTVLKIRHLQPVCYLWPIDGFWHESARISGHSCFAGHSSSSILPNLMLQPQSTFIANLLYCWKNVVHPWMLDR